MTRLLRYLLSVFYGFLPGAFVDVLSPTGHVEARLIYADGPKKGQVYKTYYGKNVVTNFGAGGTGAAPTSGRDMMRRILVPAAFTGSLAADADATVQQVKLGDGTTAETASDTDLDSEIVGSEKDLVDVDFDTGNTYVTFVFEYDESEVNQTITEAGLLSGRGDFLARKTFGSFSKTNEFTLQIRWQLRF